MFERPLAITLLLIVDLLLSVPVKEFRKCDEVVKFGYLFYGLPGSQLNPAKNRVLEQTLN